MDAVPSLKEMVRSGRYDTDKGVRPRKPTLHSYLDTYQRLLEPLRNSPICLLEVGVRAGGSLRLWRDFFPQGEIVGVDTEARCQVHGEPRIRTVCGNVLTLDLDLLPAACDVIIDDGSHRLTEQIDTFRRLFPLVKTGGLYVIEDIVNPNPLLDLHPNHEVYDGRGIVRTRFNNDVLAIFRK